MGYYLQALIGPKKALGAPEAEFRNARLFPLVQGMALIPLTDDLHDEVGKGGEVDQFMKLSSAVEQWAQRISFISPLAYVEAEFFGGVGGQSAIVWSRGARVIGPIHSLHAINPALRLLGVKVGKAHDEFDAVGLGRHRHTNKWKV